MNHVIIPATGAVPVLFVGMSKKPVSYFIDPVFNDSISYSIKPYENDVIFIPKSKYPGPWEVLGFSSELTEEQCDSLVKHPSDGMLIWQYKSFVENINMNTCDTATESLATLMQSVGAYTVNPLPMPLAGESFYQDCEEYEAAQKTTFPYWLALVKK